MDKILEYFQHIFQTPFQSSVLVFALILMIILLAPLIFRSIKIPGIIGLILAGVIIGPYGLNLIARNSAIDLFSTIGLLYIMFLAGLELDLKGFVKYKHKSLVFGFFTFILPILTGFPIIADTCLVSASKQVFWWQVCLPPIPWLLIQL